jgi:hypothetical protein
MSHLDIVIPPPGTPEATQVPIAAIAPTRRRSGGANGPSASDDAKSKMHITCQFRHGQAMVYELKTGARRIEIRIQRSTAPEGWHVAVLAKSDGGELSRDAVRSTRLAALEALEQTAGDVLSEDEWRGLREALSSVRAL